MRKHTLILSAFCLLGLTACDSDLTTPAGLSEPVELADRTATFAVSGPSGCPTSPTTVVTTEAGLLAAIAAASAGDVIAIDGTIVLAADVFVTVPGVTISCATPGSGLAASGSGVVYLLQVRADNVVIDRLALDATNALAGAMQSVRAGGGALDGVQLVNSDVTCGPSLCAFFIGVRNAVVTGNEIQGTPTTTGIHFQGRGGYPPGGTRDFPTDGTIVQGNTLFAGSPAGSPPFAAIRIRDGSGLTVSRNTVEGSWTNSISPTRLLNSVIEQNVLTGAQQDGISFQNFVNPGIMIGNTIENNRISGAAIGIRINLACDNTFRGNNLSGNGSAMFPDLGALFEVDTGANTYLGNGHLIFDNGAFDCDGDAVDDPNRITGHGSMGHGGPPAASSTSKTFGELQ
jgi:parallel beta-helix repeat protein